MNKAENKHGTGGVKSPLDLRDHKYHKTPIGMSSIPFDWKLGYNVEQDLATYLNRPNFKLPVKNQNGSGSCGGQAFATYESVQDAFEKGTFTEKSAKDIYSQVYVQGGGSTGRDLCRLLVNQGACKESLIVSYSQGQPPSESFMELREQTTQSISNALTAKGQRYATVLKDIDLLAQTVRDNKGLILGVDGANNGTWLSPFPAPPQQVEWRHWLYCGGAQTINGVKYLKVLNSWGSTVGTAGWQWLGESYLPHFFEAWTLYDGLPQTNPQVINLLQQLLALYQQLVLKLKGRE